ncbi:hypothetical protein [Verminephrobacter aporrectodeae]|nr:hypothetical protein [Verminephrobacter aporrectodeae]
MSGNPMHRLALATAALCALSVASACAQDAAPDYSPAERLLFMTPQLQTLQPPTLLRYRFSRRGSLEEPFADSVTLALNARADGGCCAARGTFLSAARRLPVPDVPQAEGNPVILYFLEHDMREMQRLTQGAQRHFRKRLRLAIQQGGAVRDVTLPYQGQGVVGQEIVLSPFLDDPLRPKYEKFARKSYRFLLSAAVPGGLYGIRTRIPGEDPQARPLLVEELLIEGAGAMDGSWNGHPPPEEEGATNLAATWQTP